MTDSCAKSRPPIAVVGVSALFPGSTDATGFWRDILAGRDLLGDVPPSHWLPEDYYDPDPAAPDKTYARRGGFLETVDFDALGWGVPPSIIPATDTSQLLGLIVAEQVLRDAAREQFEQMDRSRISVILGVTSAQELLAGMVSRLQRPVWVKSLREHGLPESEVDEICQRISDHYVPWQESTFPGLLGNVVAGRIANRLDLGGTNCVTDAACASTFSALSMAVRELYMGDSDMVITGGVDTLNDIFMFMCFSKTPALSPTGDCRPFSDQADGTMLGEGLGMVALKRLTDAERDGDRIYAVVRGVGSSSDGRTKSIYSPVAEGQARALRRAYDQAGYGPETVELVEAHGTGTVAGDAAEFSGLQQVFGDPQRPERQWCALGTVKSQIGHTKAAAGAAGLFKAVMALHHKVLPSTIKVERPNPELDLPSSPFYINTETRPWLRGDDHPRRASVSSFGFGGSNFHVALEEYTGDGSRARRLRSLSSELVLMSAESGAAVAAAARQTATQLEEPGALRRLAWESQHDHDPTAHARLAIVANDEADLQQKLQRAAALLDDDPDTAFSTPDGTCYGLGGPAGGIALLFPGQGSQYLGMGHSLNMAFDVARQPWDRAQQLPLDGDRSLGQVVYPIPRFDEDQRRADEDRLRATEWAQPAIGCTSLSLLALLRRLGIQPQAVAGHSYGEVTALHAAGVLSEVDLLRVARRRGELMAAAADLPGTMTAVSATIDEVRALLDELGTEVVVANHNAPDQVVVSGAIEAIAGVEAALETRGLRFRRLPVATAFHSPVVSASVEPFAEFLADIELGSAEIDVFSGESAAVYEPDAPAVRARLAQQIARPIRFVDLVEALRAAGVHTFVEVGPGSVLTGLVDRILGDRPHAAVALDRKGKDGVESLLRGLARLVAGGVQLDLTGLWDGYGEPPNPAARRAPKLAVPINGANYGKPYPPPGGAAELPPPNPPRPAPQPATPAENPMPPKPDHTAIPQPATVATPTPSAAPNGTAWPATAPPPDGWVAAWQEAQRQTAEAHTAFQRAMADAHGAYLHAAESSFAGLASIVGGAAPVITAVPPQPSAALPQRVPEQLAPQPTAPTPMAPAPMAPAPVPIAPPAAAPAPPADPAATAPIPVTPPAPPEAPSVTSNVDLEALMLAVVAEKTGYPAEMLELGMDLEGDLGIDSIKRIEILVAVEEQAPQLPPMDTGRMGTLKTLGEIVQYIEELIDGSTDGPPAAAATEAAVAAPPPPQTDGNPGPRSEPSAAPLSAAPLRAAPLMAAPLSRYRLELVDVPAVGLAQPGLLGAGEVEVTETGDELAAVLAAELIARGVNARAVPSPSEGAGAVIFLGGLRDIAHEDEAVAVQREAFRAARVAARSIAAAGGLFVTVQDTGGGFGLDPSPGERALLGGLPALVKTASQEWPEASLKAIDIARDGRSVAALATALADELLLGGGEQEIALAADGRRRTLRSVESPVQIGESRVGPGDVIVVSGGARGVTAACVTEWAAECGATFVLLGRSELTEEPACCAGVVDDAGLKRTLLEQAGADGENLTPAELSARVNRVQAAREIHATVAAIRATGAEARYLAADVTDASAVADSLHQVRTELGPIVGLVHGAGVLADKPIAEQTDEQFDRVFETKVTGLRTLLAATAADPLRLICLFSSVSARCGNNGQSSYAMANEVLNKVAWAEARARGDDVLVRSLGWGPWQGGMVTPELEKHFAALGVPMIPLPLGARMLADEMRSTSPEQVELVLGGEPRPEALRVAGAEARVLRLEVSLSRQTHGYLADHSIGGTVTVPVVLALEWFTRIAGAFRPDLQLAGLKDLKVLQGIKLTDFDGPGQRLILACRQIDNGDGALLALELCNPEGAVHYRAIAEMVRSREPAAHDGAPQLQLDDWGGAAIYGDVLFHGADFQVIQHLDGVGHDGISGTLGGVNQAGWTWESWHTDVAAMDGGLQLAVLWARRELGGAALPMAIGSFRSWTDRPPLGLIRCAAECRRVGSSKGVAQLVFLDEANVRIAEMRDVELILRPDQPELAARV